LFKKRVRIQRPRARPTLGELTGSRSAISRESNPVLTGSRESNPVLTGSRSSSSSRESNPILQQINSQSVSSTEPQIAQTSRNRFAATAPRKRPSSLEDLSVSSSSRESNPLLTGSRSSTKSSKSSVNVNSVRCKFFKGRGC
jgi:hypothetical protein